jgi:phytanoyl-CoA hydroxylase
LTPTSNLGDNAMNVIMNNTKPTEEFNEQGYTILRNFLDPETVAKAIEAIIEVSEEHIDDLVKAGKIENAFESEPWETRLARIYENCSETPPTLRTELHKKGLFAIFGNPALLDVVEKILGQEIRLYPNYSVRPKLPDHEASLVLWHQDAGYTDRSNQDGQVAGSAMVNVWTPFVPATIENGCMQFVPKTHKLGVVKHIEKEYYLEIDSQVLDPLRDQAVDIELEPGDIVLFSNLLFHQGLPNKTQSIRWSGDWRYQDARQSTLRTDSGHIVRSQKAPDTVVKDANHWAELTFG